MYNLNLIFLNHLSLKNFYIILSYHHLLFYYLFIIYIPLKYKCDKFGIYLILLHNFIIPIFVNEFSILFNNTTNI